MGHGLGKVAFVVGFYKGFVLSVDCGVISEWRSTCFVGVWCTRL